MSAPEDGIPVVSANAEVPITNMKQLRIRTSSKKRLMEEPSAPAAEDMPPDAEAEAKAPEPEAPAPDEGEVDGAMGYDSAEEFHETDADEAMPNADFTPYEEGDEYDDDRLDDDPDDINQEFAGAWNEELDFD